MFLFVTVVPYIWAQDPLPVTIHFATLCYLCWHHCAHDRTSERKTSSYHCCSLNKRSMSYTQQSQIFCCMWSKCTHGTQSLTVFYSKGLHKCSQLLIILYEKLNNWGNTAICFKHKKGGWSVVRDDEFFFFFL